MKARPERPERRRERQAIEKAQKIRIKLGVEPNLLEALPGHPKGMRHAIYRRLLGALIAAEEKVFATVKLPTPFNGNIK